MAAESNFNRWWWRAWYVYFGGTLMWLGLCIWLARPLAPWTQGWVGWFTGDRSDSLPLWHLEANIHRGSEVARIDGNPAFRISPTASIRFGHWREKRPDMTWAGWVRVTTPSGRWPTNFAVLRSAVASDLRIQIGIEDGKPKAWLEDYRPYTDPPSTNRTEISGVARLAAGKWFHLAFTTDGKQPRLVIDGETAAEVPMYLHPQIFLADLLLSCEPAIPGEPNPECVSEQDDVVLYDRVVSPEELKGLAMRGRGGWAAEIKRPALAAKVWRIGWPLAVTTLLVLLAVRFLPEARRYLVSGIRMLTQSAFQSVRWTLVVGLLVAIIVTTLLAQRAAREDKRRFNQALFDLTRRTDIDWERITALLVRARDWIATQTNLTRPAWDSWLLANRFPHAYPGVLGVGYAQQVLPTQRDAHEAELSARHGFAYRIHPNAGVPRQAVRELEGNPLLPVVLYESRTLDPKLWLTNHSILGQDLLFRSVDDPRPWAAARRVEEVAARNEVQTSSLEEIAPAGWYGSPVHGIRLYMPWTLVTKRDEGPQFPLASKDWRGVIFANVDVSRLVREQLGTNASLIGFRLYTGGSGGDRHDRVLDTGDIVPATAERTDAALRGRLAIPFYYRRLYVEAWTTPAFDAQSLRRWPWIVGAAGVAITLLASALLFVQVRARAEQARVLQALREANSELLLAQRERERLSRDLHDGSIQNLYGLGLHLQRVQTLLETSPDKARAELKDSLAMLDQSIAELRQFILTAGTDSLQQHTVASALEGLVERLRKTTSIDIQLHLDEQAATLNPRAGVQLLNIVREAVSNTLRHADARHIEVRLEPSRPESEAGPLHWRLRVSDDGCGFDKSRLNGHGRGLKNMTARATELNGSSAIESTPGSGTRVVVEFPARRKEAGTA